MVSDWGDLAGGAEHLASPQLCALSPVPRTSASARAGVGGLRVRGLGDAGTAKAEEMGGERRESHACLITGLQQTHCRPMFWFFFFHFIVWKRCITVGFLFQDAFKCFFTPLPGLEMNIISSPLYLYWHGVRAAGMQGSHSCTAPWTKGYIKHATCAPLPRAAGLCPVLAGSKQQHTLSAPRHEHSQAGECCWRTRAEGIVGIYLQYLLTHS